MIRVWRIPYSTNCARVELAARLAGVPLDWVEVDAHDRAPVLAVSGQRRVPVAGFDGEIVIGSLQVVARIAPSLWPAATRERAETEVFLDWFERVWMQALGVVSAEIAKPDPDVERIERAGRRLDGYMDRFEALLDGRDFVLGTTLSIADVATYPLLRYATDRTPGDDYAIHDELRRLLSVDGRPRLAAWLERVAVI